MANTAIFAPGLIESTAGLEGQTENVTRFRVLVEQLTGDRSEDERVRVRSEIVQVMDAMGKRSEDTQILSSLVNKQNEFFWDVYTFRQDLTIHVLRCGSKLVELEVQNYAQTVMNLHDADIIIPTDVKKLMSNEHAAKTRLQAAIGKALKEGPFAG